MADRKQIRKKTRFEVFKRDNFICQYCGKSAPEVVLEIDHIKPVKEGGTNDIMNLVTSCRECNRGKGARELGDDSTIMKQKKQLEELNERREQLEMMIQWREGLSNLADVSLEAATKAFEKHTYPDTLNQVARDSLRKLIKQYGLNEVLESIEISTSYYLERDRQGEITDHSFNKAFEKIAGICRSRKITKEKPYMDDLFHLHSIMQRKYWYVGKIAIHQMEKAYKKGMTIEEMQEVVSSTSKYSEFDAYLNEFFGCVDSNGDD